MSADRERRARELLERALHVVERARDRSPHSLAPAIRAYLSETGGVGPARDAGCPACGNADCLDHCPRCGGEADNGHDRCIPPSPYVCSKCAPATPEHPDADEEPSE